MARLYVRDFPDHLHRKLKQRARATGRTLGAEIEAMLREALARKAFDEGLKETVHLLRSPKNAARLLAALARARGRSTSSKRFSGTRSPGSGSPNHSSTSRPGPGPGG
jgi:plasmid stability protein